MRRTGGDKHRLARDILSDAEPRQGLGNNVFRFGQPTGAHHPAGEIATARLDDMHATLPQNLQVRLGRRMLPHVDIHCRRKDDWSFCGQVECAEEIVGDALSKLCDQCRR